jgi:hypothetical protein
MHDIETAWGQLDTAEHNRQSALTAELIRYATFCLFVKNRLNYSYFL